MTPVNTDAIRAQLNHMWHRLQHTNAGQTDAEDVPRLIATLHAALDRHVEGPGTGPGHAFRYCQVCDETMPCQELRIIAEKLGGIR